MIWPGAVDGQGAGCFVALVDSWDAVILSTVWDGNKYTKRHPAVLGMFCDYGRHILEMSIS